jgi:peptidoglycan/LPS O-acetylase OafA/YrhL
MIAASSLVPRGYHPIAGPITVLVLVLLAAVLIAIEILRTYDEPRTQLARRRLLVAGGPLMIASVAIVAARLAPLIN